MDQLRHEELGTRIKSVRARKGLTQRELAKLCRVSHSFIGLLESNQRGAEKDTLISIGNALGMQEPELGELLEIAGYSTLDVHLPLANARKLLLETLAELPEGSCCTFYVEDPNWPDELRLVDMHGVNRVETMHGFISWGTSNQVLKHGEDESFCEDAIAASERRDSANLWRDAMKPEIQCLFGDFVERENIRSSARFLVRKVRSTSTGNVESVVAVLFVNFRRPVEFTSTLTQQLRQLRNALAPEIPAIQEALRLRDAPVLQQAIRILKPAQDWVATGMIEDDSVLKRYFESTLDAAMAAVGVDTGKCVGTIHLFDVENARLNLAAHRGSLDPERIERARVQKVSRGEGIITWVAVRRRAIVIHDLTTDNPFSEIHIPIKDGVRSELAVPMLAGDLVGVLNLESTQPGAFLAEHVRPLCYAANNAAVAARLCRQAITNRRLARLNSELLSWCANVIAKKHSPEFVGVDELCQMATSLLKATRCDIWRFDADRPTPFYGAGASYKSFESETPPRRGGWSEYVCRARCAVWIADVRSRFSYEVAFWDEQTQSWRKRPAKHGVPEAVNQRVVELMVGSELGIPIVSGDECVGVAWLKFDEPDRARPGLDEMLLAIQFAAGVGRVVVSLAQLV